jgi:hypothetical protein
MRGHAESVRPFKKQRYPLHACLFFYLISLVKLARLAFQPNVCLS